MLKLLQTKISPLQRMDKNGFIKRDFAAEKQLSSQLKSRGVINFDLDEIMSDDEQDNDNQQNVNDSSLNSSKLHKIKNFVIRNPYLKEILKEAKHFISRKSASLKEYFNFAAMNPVDNNQSQANNVEQQSISQKTQNQQQSGTQNQPTSVQNKDTQSISSILEDIQGNQERSDSSIGSNNQKFSQNDSLSISSRVQQFIQEQKNQIREQEERRMNSLNLSFRSASNYFNRQSTTSVQSETLQNKRQNKLMESIMRQNTKKLKTSQEEINSLPLNKQTSIRFLDINKAFENEELEQSNYDHKTSKQKAQLSQSEISRKNKESSGKDSKIQGNLSNLTEEEIEEQKRKDLKIEMEARKFVMNKLPQSAKIRVQLKRILEMKQQARKLNINYSEYAEEIHKQQQLSKDSKFNKQQQILDLKEKRKEKYQVKLTNQQLKDLNRQSNSHYSQFLQDPDVVLSRESSYIAYKSQVQQGETSKLSQPSLSKQQSQQKNYISDHDSTLLVEQNKASQNKKSQKKNEQNKGGNNNFSDSQSNYEESCSSPVSSSNSITSNKKPKLSQQPFDDEFSMSSIQRHTDDEDSAIIMNIFPNNSSAPNNNNTLNSNNTQSQTNNSLQQSQLFKKPQEKKVTEEPSSSTGINIKINGTPQSQLKEQVSDQSQNKLFSSASENTQTISIAKDNLFGNIKNNQEESKQITAQDSSKKEENKIELTVNQKESIIPSKPAVGLFGNLSSSQTADKPSTPSLFVTETKSATNSLFTTEVKPASASLFSGLTDVKPASNSLFSGLTEPKTPASGSLFSSNLTPSTNSQSTPAAATASSTENKSSSLFGNLGKTANEDAEKTLPKTEATGKSDKDNQKADNSKSTGLFSNINATSSENSNNKGGLFSSLNGAPSDNNSSKQGGLFSNLNGTSTINNSSQQGGLFSNISQKGNDSDNKTPEKKAQTSNLFAPIQQNEIKQDENKIKDSEMEMASEHTDQQASSQLNKTAQVLSTPQPSQNSQTVGSAINSFGNNVASPFSQHPFSTSSQQIKQQSLQDLVSGNNTFFNQNGPQIQNNTNNNNLQGGSLLNNTLFSQSNNGLFQQPQNNPIFQSNQISATPQLNNQMTSNFGSFQNSLPNQSIGQINHFSGLNPQQNNAFNSTNMNNNNLFNQPNSSIVNNTPFQVNSNLNFNANFQPQANYFGVNSNTSQNSGLFQSTTQNINPFMNQSVNQSASLFGGAQQQNSLFSSTSTSQASNNQYQKKKNTNNKQRI
ncbi:hypothetical protein TTHERM_00379010 (macronuclear) [Tetrahymena thermophila SB210]|uniref:Uncharacterized protein n=1 Tax=Tetrahymena thermophila (strain SB210) TaxID=312017 RepID=Q23FB6_TETTS|nr:hypothetical protein TTHERM_00379010 [Tetrahymena thermophila SB210]EAR95237.2 hypothetical protein TTHERM_00379010 [Tetrahymena thermophila SB210]|eukprot:XP_001015482.2 hypothetical protein TTHERM_00379010 [Tetrahymena thermophila SB210]